MKKKVTESMAAIVGAVLVATAIAWAGSQNGVTIGGLPLFAGFVSLNRQLAPARNTSRSSV